MRLVLIIPSMGGGGAERVMATLANAWAADGMSVTLITLTPSTGDKYPLHAAVERVALDVSGASPNALAALRNNAQRLRALRRAMRAAKPDAVISFTTTVNLLALLAARGLQVPVIVSERAFVGAQPPRGVWRHLYRPLYRRAAAVVAQTQRGAADLEARLARPVSVISNPVREIAAEADNAAREKAGYLVQASGRLEPQKGFDILIDAFAGVAAAHPDWRLRIAGEGSARAGLTAQIARHGLAARIELSGFDNDLQASTRSADLFVLSSRYEGMPNVLLEAMSLGLCCISADCETGPREIIDHGDNGWLVPAEDAPALGQALHTLMQDGALRQRLGAKAAAVQQTYSLASVLAQWNTLLASALKPARSGTQAQPQERAAGASHAAISSSSASTPRVLFLIRSLGRGGAERQLVALATGLRRKGWDVAVACFYAGGPFQRDLEQGNVPIIDLRKRGRWDNAGFLWRLWRAMRTYQPDIVHGYLTVGNLLSLMARVACPGTRVLWGVRSSYIDRSQYDWTSRTTFALSCKLSRFAHAIIFNSDAGAAHHVTLGYPRELARVVPNGIDTDRFQFTAAGRTQLREAWGMPADVILVGLVGRIDSMKDHPTFIQAAALLASRASYWRFVCVGGGGDSDYAQGLKAQAQSLGLGDRLIWVGPQDDMPAIYSALDIAVSTSYGEGFPNIVAEAMACGRPCVVTDVGDSARIVGTCGAVVEARNPAVFATAVERTGEAMRHRGDEGDIQAAAQSRIRESYAMESLLRNSEAAFRTVCKAPWHP